MSKGKVNLFAIDTRIKKVVNTEDYGTKLQEDIKKHSLKKNNMEFYGSMFGVLKFGSNKTLKENTEYHSSYNRKIEVI